MVNFINALQYCTSSGSPAANATIESYDSDTPFSLFDYYYEENIKQPTYAFENIEDLIKVVQVVKIEDWITKFLFGNKFGKGINIVSSMKLEDRIDILNGFWTPKLYLGKGLCYSFEPRLNELDSMPVISMDEMLSMELTFNVSRCIDKSIFQFLSIRLTF